MRMSFTRSWLVKRRAPGLVAIHGRIEQVALGVLHAGLFGRAFFPGAPPSYTLVRSAGRNILCITVRYDISGEFGGARQRWS